MMYFIAILLYRLQFRLKKFYVYNNRDNNVLAAPKL